MATISHAPIRPFHWNVKNLLGRRFGKLQVVSEAGRSHKRSVIWNCQCDCGREVTRQGSTLLAGKSSSCGCLIRSPEVRAKIAFSQRKPGSLMRREFRHCRDGAGIRGHQWNLSIEEFSRLVTASCEYCGADATILRQTAHETARFNGVDRVDNSKGYDVRNCVPCCKVCNYMKRGLSVEEFVAQAAAIVAHQKERRVAIS